MKKFFNNPANKRVLLSVFYWIFTFILPTAVFYYGTNELLINSLIETKHAWTLLCLALAGFCKAVSDTVDDHYSISKFSLLKSSYWNGEIGWMRKYDEQGKHKVFLWIIPVPDFFTDAWHTFQGSMISLIVIGCVCYEPFFSYFDRAWLNVVSDLVALRLMFAIGFVGPYNWYLLKPENRIK